METGPQVSVVLPVHDTPLDFFREAIDSVRAQREVRWELLIVLDAASERCARMAREMAELDPQHIRVVGGEGGAPRGPSGARNFGISHARAPLVGFLDADDVLEATALAERCASLDAHPDAAMVYGATLYWHSWAADAAHRESDYIPALGVQNGTFHPPAALLTRFLDGSAAVPCTCSLLVSRAAIETTGAFDETVRSLYEDQTFLARLTLRYPVVVADRVLDRYRQHPGSWTSRWTTDTLRDARAQFLEWLEREMASAGVRDPVLVRTIERERWKLRHPRLARVLRFVRRSTRRASSAVRAIAASKRPDEGVRPTRERNAG
jgi:glycosyltransferase involved in cell wall biosynthesis